MDNQQIINEIKEKLTKDKAVDVAYLETELVVFRTLKNEEVTLALEQLLFTYLSKEEKAEYDQKAHEILSVRADLYIEAQKAIDDGDLKKAKSILSILVKTYEKIENIKTFNYYDFEQMIEYIMFSKTVSNAKKLNVKRYPEPITYYTYQLALVNEGLGDINDAIFYLKKALKFNPCSMYVLLELTKLYLDKSDWDNLYNTICYALEYAYTKEQFSLLFANLASYYKALKREDLSHTSMLVSDAYKKGVALKKIDEIKDVKQLAVSYLPSTTLMNAIDEFIPFLKSINDLSGINYLLTIKNELVEEK